MFGAVQHHDAEGVRETYYVQLLLFEVLIGMHSADRSTDKNKSAQRREKQQKHQQWHPNRIQFVFVNGFKEQH
jgi:hypothetical protein